MMKAISIPEGLRTVCNDLSEPVIIKDDEGNPVFVLMRWEDFVSTEPIEEEEVSPEELQRILDIESKSKRSGTIPLEDVLKKYGIPG